MKKKPVSMLPGYLLGGLLVLILMPGLIWLLSFLADVLVGRIPVFGNDTARWIVAFVLLVVGFSFGLSSIIRQNVVGQGGPLEIANIEISPKTRNLVVSGPYRYTRNPMLFGTFLIYGALSLLINSWSAVLIVLLFAVFMLRVVVPREEERLLRDFGEAYKRYRERTSLIIPWFTKRN